MIVATAGHVDHGKTSLVRALTGVDTDRLPDEKKRGLTIDLGFAYLAEAGRETIGFVDVPGHERFIRNALCGLTGADFVLFVIAVDDGPMPQTREHLAIIDLMGLNHGAIALTKTDTVSEERVAEVAREVEALFSRTTLSGSPCFAVSSATGNGIADLKAHLTATRESQPQRTPTGHFRLAVDRTFHVSGAGLVATGTVFSGTVNVGDAARVAGKEMDVRIRGLHAQSAESVSGRAGQRCALNLTGGNLRKHEIARGDWIVAPQTAEPVLKFDALLRLVANTTDLPHWTPVHVHLGAGQTTGRVAVLEGKHVAAGETQLVQLVLDKPLGAVAGDRFIVRDQSALKTLGGGHVLDIFPPTRGRAKPTRVAWLNALRENDHRAALMALLGVSETGVDLDQFQTNRNLTHAEMTKASAGAAHIVIDVPPKRVAFSHETWSAIESRALETVARVGEGTTTTQAITESEILAASRLRLAPELTISIARQLAREGKLVNDNLGVRLPDHRVQLGPPHDAMWADVETAFIAAALRPLTLHDLAERAGHPVPKLKSLLSRASRLGLIVYISKTRITTPTALRQLGRIAEGVADDADDSLISVAHFRDRSDVGRNAAIEILEYFDKQRLTRRVGNARELIGSAAEQLKMLNG